jgi:hypothetical protein
MTPQRPDSSADPDGPPITPPTENAWRLYEVTMEWVRHADAKATALLAANVTLAAGLLALDKLSDVPTPWVTLTLIAVGASFVLAALAVVPNLRTGSATSLVFFDHVARRHDTADAYAAAQEMLLDTPDALRADLAGQTWHLARVARSKYLATGFSIIAFILAGGAAVALVIKEMVAP